MTGRDEQRVDGTSKSAMVSRSEILISCVLLPRSFSTAALPKIEHCVLHNSCKTASTRS